MYALYAMVGSVFLGVIALAFMGEDLRRHNCDRKNSTVSNFSSEEGLLD